jgi:sigma-B regulation protein RsbU (phosphoserine phosphatase)
VKSRLINIVLVALLLAADAYFVLNAVRASRVYPFARVDAGGELLYRTSLADRDDPFGAKVFAVNGAPVAGGLYDALAGTLRGDRVPFTLEVRGTIAVGFFRAGTANREVLWFFIILLLLANIHYIYGLMVRLFKWNSHQSRLFFYLSLAQSAFYFLITDLLSFARLKPLFLLAAAALAYCIVLAGYNISRYRLSRRAAAAYIILTAALAAATLGRLSMPADRVDLVAVFAYITVFGAIATWKLARGIFTEKNRYMFKNEGMALIGLTLSFLVPPAFFIAGLFIDIPLPVHYASAFSLAMPLIIGNSIFQYNLFSSRLFFLKGMLLLLVNLVTALAAGALIYYASVQVKSLFELAGYYLLFTAVFAALLVAERAIRRKLGDVLLVNRDNYSRSLQNIENLASTHEDISFKIERVFTEISLIMGVPEIQLLLFDRSHELKAAEESGLVEHLSPDSDLVKYWGRDKGVIFKYSLIRRSSLEERITRFLDRRNIIIASPIASEEKLIGALLLGEKQSGDLFSGIDINYIETVSLQIRQMLENDRLLKNYITRRRFEMELDIASYIQTRLFPKSAPESSRLAISFYNRPYLKVTGDYFDFIEIDKKTTAIVIGDISGHGLAAAMILSMTNSIIHSLLREKMPVEQVIEEVNYFLNNRYRGTELITLFAGIYNNVTRELSYINAGHCPPAVIRGGRGELTRLEGRSKILGADPSAVYSASKVSFERDDELFLFTDGAMEIYEEKTGREFGEQQLLDTIRARAGSDIEGKINALIDTINSFSDSIQDDITLIAVRFN